MKEVRLRTLERVNAEVLMISSVQNVKRPLEFGRRGARKMTQAKALRSPEGAVPTLNAPPSRNPLQTTSSVTDHRRLM
jgi:hypothetical protein